MPGPTHDLVSPAAILPRAAQRFGDKAALVTPTRTRCASPRWTIRRGRPARRAGRADGARPLVMLGYHNRPKATAETIEPLPKTSTGKIMRRELIKLYEQ